MKTHVRIYKPAKNAMQSGRGGRSDHWRLEGMELSPRAPEHLMGWASAEDTNDQISMAFDCKDAAIAFAESKGWVYEVHDPAKRTIRPRNYLDNFKYRPLVYQPVKIEKKAEQKEVARAERSGKSGTKVKKSDTAGMEKARPADNKAKKTVTQNASQLASEKPSIKKSAVQKNPRIKSETKISRS